LRLFRSRGLTGANLIMIIIGATMFSLFFFLTQYLQNVHGYSPLKAGLAFIPMPLAIILGTQLSTRLVQRVGPRLLLTIGPLISAFGMLLLSRIHADSSYPLHVGLAGSITTFGVGMSFVPVTLSATNGVDPHDAGLASGLINTTRQIGGSLGLAVLLTLAASRTHALAGEGAKVATTAGYAHAYQYTAIFLVVAAVVAAAVLPPLRRPVPQPAASAPLELTPEPVAD
jgi:predicted MFS family arabinose efflux permease